MVTGFAAGLAVCAAVVLVWQRSRPSPAVVEALPPIRFSVLPPSGTDFGPAGVAPFPAISPDGMQIAFQTIPEGSLGRVWVRSLDSSEAHFIAGKTSVTPALPFWSPDGRSIGLFADGQLRRIDLDGDRSRVLTEVQGAYGGTWTDGGMVVYGEGGGLLRVSATGGTPVPVTKVDASNGELSHGHPHMLPDGRHFLFWIHANNGGWVAVGSLESQGTTRLFQADAGAQYAPGYVLFVRQSTLYAQSFDPETLRTAGEPAALAAGVRNNPSNGRAAFSVSPNGVLVYRTGGAVFSGQLAWYDLKGNKLGPAGGDAQYQAIAISPDNKFAVAQLRDESRGLENLWRIDLTRGTSSRVTSGQHHDKAPQISPDGEWVLFASDRSGVGDLYKRRANGVGEDQPVVRTAVQKIPTDWKARWMVFSAVNSTQSDIWTLSTEPGASPQSYLATPFDEGRGRLSPDGHWMAYDSNETGRPEVYVRPFPDGNAGVWRISTSGGLSARWWPDGKGLFYIDQLYPVDIMSVALTFENGRVHAETPKPLFKPMTSIVLVQQFVPSNDGRLLIPASIGDEQQAPLTVIVNWTSLLSKK